MSVWGARDSAWRSQRACVPVSSPHIGSTQRPAPCARAHAVPTLARAGQSPTQQRPAGSRDRCPHPPREPLVPLVVISCGHKAAQFPPSLGC